MDNPDEVFEEMRRSPFKVVGEPAALGGYPTIRAFQVQGPDNEVIYATAETGDRSRSVTPIPGDSIDRIFIMVVAGPKIDDLIQFYSSAFHLKPGTPRLRAGGVLRRAQGLGDDATLPLTTA